MFILHTISEFLITLWRGQFRPNLGPKNVFLFNFTRILSFFGTEKILVFSNIFGFPAVHWAPNWSKTVNFGCLPFKLKFKSLKDFLNTVFALLETTSGQNSATLNNIWGSKDPNNSKKGPFHGC